MKKIFRSLFLISIVTVCSLAYVALQVELYRLSYSIHKKKQLLAETQDLFEGNRVRLFKLEALDVLEKKIESSQIEFAFPAEVKAIEMPSHPQAGVSENIHTLPVESDRPFISLLQFVREAHAKIISSEKN